MAAPRPARRTWRSTAREPACNGSGAGVRPTHQRPFGHGSASDRVGPGDGLLCKTAVFARPPACFATCVSGRLLARSRPTPSCWAPVRQRLRFRDVMPEGVAGAKPWNRHGRNGHIGVRARVAAPASGAVGTLENTEAVHAYVFAVRDPAHDEIGQCLDRQFGLALAPQSHRQLVHKIRLVHPVPPITLRHKVGHLTVARWDANQTKPVISAMKRATGRIGHVRTGRQRGGGIGRASMPRATRDSRSTPPAPATVL